MSLHVELVLVLRGLAADADQQSSQQQQQQQLRARLARPPHRGSIDRTGDGWCLRHLMAGTCSRHEVSEPPDVEVVHPQAAPSAGETPARLCNLPTPTLASSQVPRPLQSRRSPLPATLGEPRSRGNGRDDSVRKRRSLRSRDYGTTWCLSRLAGTGKAGELEPHVAPSTRRPGTSSPGLAGKGTYFVPVHLGRASRLPAAKPAPPSPPTARPGTRPVARGPGSLGASLKLRREPA